MGVCDEYRKSERIEAKCSCVATEVGTNTLTGIEIEVVNGEAS